MDFIACVNVVSGPILVPGLPGAATVWEFILTDDAELAELIREALADGAVVTNFGEQLWGEQRYLVTHNQ